MTLKDDVYEELEGLIGKEATNRLIDYFVGSSIYIPKRIINEQRNRKIRDEFKNGVSYKELAIRYGYSETHIRNIIHKTKGKGSPVQNKI